MLINGVEYGWSDIKCRFLGRTPEGITALEYSDNREKQNNYGKGSKPVSRGRGKYAAEFKMTLSMKEMEAIQRALPKGRKIQDIPMFDVDIAYEPEDGSSPIVRDRILNVEFTNKARKITTGDGEILHECVMICSEIEWDV